VFILTYVHSYGFIAKISKASGIVSKNVQANTAQELVCRTHWHTRCDEWVCGKTNGSALWHLSPWCFLVLPTSRLV